MQQLEMTFFWPLTEQTKLDLDYTESIRHAEKKYEQFRLQDHMRLDSGNLGVGSNPFHGLTANSICIDFDKQIVLRSSKKPNVFVRFMYKLLGLKWQKK